MPRNTRNRSSRRKISTGLSGGKKLSDPLNEFVKVGLAGVSEFGARIKANFQKTK